MCPIRGGALALSYEFIFVIVFIVFRPFFFFLVFVFLFCFCSASCSCSCSCSWSCSSPSSSRHRRCLAGTIMVHYNYQHNFVVGAISLKPSVSSSGDYLIKTAIIQLDGGSFKNSNSVNVFPSYWKWPKESCWAKVTLMWISISLCTLS